MRKILFRGFLFLLLFCLPAVCALAAGPDCWLSADGQLTADAITIQKDEGNGYTLYLPGNRPSDQLVFGLADGFSLTVGSKKIKTGDSAAFLKEGSYSIKLGKRSTKLRVMRGSENLPAVYVTTESGKLKRIESSRENREPGSLVFCGPEGDIQYDGALDHIKCRGNSSMTFKKKNYQIKLATGASLLGMGKAKKWILTGNYRDKSLLRNQLVLSLAAAVGLSAPENSPAELYINHEYRGLYLFSEKVEVDDDRVNITDLEKATEELNTEPLSSFKRLGKGKSTKGAYKAYDIPQEPEDFTGGYLLEYEGYPVRYKSEPSAYTTKKGGVLVLKSPEYATDTQMKYISSLMQSLENAIMAKDGVDPDTGKHYTEIADADSLALKYMIEELSENYDGNSSSQYFYKDRDSVSDKVFAGPVWDYDSAFGSYAAKHNARYVLNPAHLWIAQGDATAWYPALWRHTDFKNRVADLWETRMKGGVEALLGISSEGAETARAAGLSSIDEMEKRIHDSAMMDRNRWPRPATSDTIAQTGQTLEANIAFLRDFLQKRYDFLNQTWVPQE